MKYLLILTIFLYKKIISPILDALFGAGNGCRFELTCSEYSIKAISKYGALKGSYLSVKRILHCHPYSRETLKYESI